MFKPINNRVLVRPEKSKEKTASGIILPEDKEKPVVGTIVVSDSQKYKFKQGDRVIFSKFGYDEVKIEDKLYYVVSENNILGIF